MIVNGKHYLTLWWENGAIHLIDQNKLPFIFDVMVCRTWEETAEAIRNMNVRGAGAIGAAAGFAMAQAFLQASSINKDEYLLAARAAIEATRPTARDLFFATQRVSACSNTEEAIREAQGIAAENSEEGRLIGIFGEPLIKDGMGILTHCNAGWIAFVDNGSALSPIYEAKRKNKDFTVFVDETRPRCQGARLTAWELGNENVRHHIIADNAAAYMMQHGKIQLVIVGTDRVAANGDIANKIGTLEKAILADYFGIPFYVAAPLSTFDLSMTSGNEIPVEFRSPDEVLSISGLNKQGEIENIKIAAPGSQALNPAFDVTPAALITGLITSKGIIKPNKEEISKLFH